MKVQVVGSGSMWNAYNSASYKIDHDILVDVPNGMCKNLFRQKTNPIEIEHVLLTHFHGDHYFDMPFFYLLKSKSEKNKVTVYCSKEGIRKIKKITLLAFPNSCKDIFKELDLKYQLQNSFQIASYKIKKVLVDHGRMAPAYGYLFHQHNKVVGFTGDTSLCETVEKMASQCDYLFCDGMLLKGTKSHMGIDNITYLCQKYPNCIFVVSHLEDEIRKAFKKLECSNIVVPDDGQVFDIE